MLFVLCYFQCVYPYSLSLTLIHSAIARDKNAIVWWLTHLAVEISIMEMRLDLVTSEVKLSNTLVLRANIIVLDHVYS